MTAARLTVAACKDLANLERDFRHIKADDRDLRPIWHRPGHRVKRRAFDLIGAPIPLTLSIT